MKIVKVHIENFRSIKSLTFHPRDICAFVGENGAGKSNIMAALDFLLGEKWPSSRSLDVSDYYNHDEGLRVVIGVEFAVNEHRIHKVWFDGSAEKECNYSYFGSDEKRSLSNQVREKCALVYISANRDLEQHLRMSPWALLGRIVNQFDRDFPDERREPLRNHFDEALKLLRTPKFEDFEGEVSRAFADELKRTGQDLTLHFSAFDARSYYRSLRLVLQRQKADDETISLDEAGQGMGSLALMALFRAYAKVFRGDAIIAIEEPEIYLHPHAQRSLMSLFGELSVGGNQIFYSTHSSNFVRVENFDCICLVERCPDEDGDVCTIVRQVASEDLLEARRKLHLQKANEMTVESMRERYRSICGLEHGEAFFARKIVLVEGETEQDSLPIYACNLGYDFDSDGVSVVNAGGKTNLDQFYDLYTAFGIPVYIIFDSDVGSKKEVNLDWNEVLLRMLGEQPVREPTSTVQAKYAVMERDFENEMQTDLSGLYSELMQEATSYLGGGAGKGLKAHYIAQRLDSKSIPRFIKAIIGAVQNLGAMEEESDIPF